MEEGGGVEYIRKLRNFWASPKNIYIKINPISGKLIIGFVYRNDL